MWVLGLEEWGVALAVVFKPSKDTYVGWGMESFYKTLE